MRRGGTADAYGWASEVGSLSILVYLPELGGAAKRDGGQIGTACSLAWGAVCVVTGFDQRCRWKEASMQCSELPSLCNPKPVRALESQRVHMPPSSHPIHGNYEKLS